MGNCSKEIGVVVIGRNEGERLKRCLKSVQAQVSCIVYVDSGSSDGSVEYTRSIGLDVVELDMRIPFSAGRARNEGFSWLVKTCSNIEYVQFIDGDCELSEGWIYYALSFLEKNENCAIVAGRRKEKYPEKSVYNLLCDIEWNTPVGETKACGGDFMIHRKAFQQVNGFNPFVVAGEEPELCYRLAERGWRIFRLDHPMTFHDAAIIRFSQWWKRVTRSGHAYSQGYALHGRKGKGYCRKESLKIWFWAFFFPLLAILSVLFFGTAFLILFFLYFGQFARIAFRMNKLLKNIPHSLLYSFFTVISKFAQLKGQILFFGRIIRKKKIEIIEY